MSDPLSSSASCALFGAGVGAAAVCEIAGIPMAALVGAFVGALAVRVFVDRPSSNKGRIRALGEVILTTAVATLLAIWFGPNFQKWQELDRLSYAHGALAFSVGALIQIIFERAERLADGLVDAVLIRIGGKPAQNFFDAKEKSQ